MVDIKKILVVDDHFEMLEFLQSMLELSTYDYEVFAVPSAEEGMLELGRTAFDLLITDIRLPGMSGFDFVRRAQKRSRNKTLPVIMITAYSSDQGRQEAEELGVHHYFTKPFIDTDEVLTAVNQILYGQSPEISVVLDADDTPDIDIILPASVGKRLRTLTADTGAALILLATKQGKMLLQTGSIRNVNTQQMASIISSNLTNSKQLTQQLGGDAVTTIQYHAGDRLEMYTANIGPNYFMSIIFDVQVRRGRFGTIWVFTQRAIKDLQPVLPALPTETALATAVDEKPPVQKPSKRPPPSTRRTRVAPKATPARSKKEPAPPSTAPPTKPPKPKERRRRRPIYPDSASAGNVERAAKIPAKSEVPLKKKGKKPSAPPPPDFFVDGTAASSSDETVPMDIDDLKSLLGGATTNKRNDTIDLADLLVGNAPDDGTIDFSSEIIPPPADSSPSGETAAMSFAEAQKLGLFGGSILPTDDDVAKNEKPAKDDEPAVMELPESADDVDLDDFWNTAVSTTEKQNSGGGLSLEEARRQGLIP